MKINPSAVAIRRFRKEDANEAWKLSAKMMHWMSDNYSKGSYPKEAVEFDIRSYSSSHLREMLRRRGFFGFVAAKDERLCGVILGSAYTESGYSFIHWIAVDYECQNQGIGMRLMAAAEEYFRKMKCHKVGLYTLPSLLPAVNLYMRAGFVPEAYLREQWWGADFLLMSKWIGKYRKHRR